MKFSTLALAATTFIMLSCNEGTKQEANKGSDTKIETKLPAVSQLTKEDQAKLTPDSVLKQFVEGNKRFNDERVLSEQDRKAIPGQYPKAFVLSCIDSRVPVEVVFNQGLGDIFVGRVAGNFVNEHQIGSMEFATKVSGAKLVLILGHQHCGAIKGAIDDVKLGNITDMLSMIKPAVQMSQDFKGEKTSKNEEFVKLVAENNVKYNIQQIREKSPILKEMEDKGEIKIVGAFYRLTDGTFELIK